MENINYQELFNQVFLTFLKNPGTGKIEQETLNQLIAKFPYCQPLHFILASGSEKDSPEFKENLSAASFYAPKREVLYELIHHPDRFRYATAEDENQEDVIDLTGNSLELPAHNFEVAEASAEQSVPEISVHEDTIQEENFQPAATAENIQPAEKENDCPDLITKTEGYQTGNAGQDILYDETSGDIRETETAETEPETSEQEIKEVEETAPAITVPEEAGSHEDGAGYDSGKKSGTLISDDTEKLIIGNISGADFFAFEKSTADPLHQVAVTPPGTGLGESETVAKYNDDKMPYTFLWWLSKTRKEHADTYQPYVNFSLDTTQAIKKNTADELNQQIVSNIFHLQNPLEDYAVKPSGKTVEFELKRKDDDIIEKFIKEEPQIKPPQPEKIDNENKARKSAEDANDMVSETLALIYADQMLYYKSIDTYKKLSLKFPEKSAYFADQIRELEKKTN